MLLDNRTQGKVGDVLRRSIQKDARLSFISGFFSVYGFSALRQELGRATGLRLLVPTRGDQAGAINGQFHLPGLAESRADRRFRNTLNLMAVARECHRWLEQRAEIRSVSSPVPWNLFHVENPGGTAVAIHGSSPFTSSGLGLAPSDSYEMNTWLQTPTETGSLLGWFDSIWNNAEVTRDVKAAVLAQLEEMLTSQSPEVIYLVTLYNLFRDMLDELEEDKIIKTRTGIKDTLVWNKLYRFQRDGVLGAIDKIEKYNGCIIADSVGLGKTFEALAIIKYYELRNDRVLVLCPKKLRENWTLYTINDRRNLFAADRFNFDVLNHTDLTRTRGHTGEINLETVNWGNYDLVVIDESHNFRNNPPRKDGLTRYSRLMRDILQTGVKTKVLMLSATPVNSRMNDLKNQVAFITEGMDDALYAHGIASIQATLRKAQTRFNQWLRLDASERTVEGLLEALNFDYFKLLDLLTIARSRKHIEKYYDLAEIGRFPERAKPINIKADIDTRDQFPPLKEINRDIRRLNLSAYAPLKYVLPAKLEEYSRKYDMAVAGGSVFKQIDREESLIHLMRVNLFKRMESSINSFALTLERLLGDVRDLIGRIDSHEKAEIEEISIEDIEVEDEDFEPHLVGTKVKVLIQDVDRVRWKQELQEDEELLVRLLREARQIDAARDQKLHDLKDLIAGKCRQLTNPGNTKVLIFTAFADTADYLYENIAGWAHQQLGLYCALVTGRTGGNKTNMPHLRKDIASILTSFSPVSKERSKIDESLTDEISILIATDCISEGQNLQDCDYVVNYDIHWNPVRIIQRFGRIDRLGSRNAIVQLVNFWPNLELDFNSLDAQREAVEYYVAAHKHAGWLCLPQRYDDAAFSGTTTERPAFQRLLADVEAGQVDCVLVYKIDRLSRSLMDFSRIMQTFEKHKVSLVSVTQQFDTSTSMGRLSLHMLLSFAQFERDLISERTRDKIAAARRRGNWTGGRPVLGYDRVRDAKGSRLMVNLAEAERVRQIFRKYLELGSLGPVVRWLERRGLRNKQYATLAGNPRGGQPLDKGTLYKMLTNRVYCGKIGFQGQEYEGRHEAIVSEDLFGRVQGLLRLNKGSGDSLQRNRGGALLRGLVRCKHCDRSMIHYHCYSRHRRYRYYLCITAQRKGWTCCPHPTLPAEDLEQFVLDRVRRLGPTPQLLSDTIQQARQCVRDQIRHLKYQRTGQKNRLRRIDQDLRHVLEVPAAPGAEAGLARLREERHQVAEALLKTNQQIVELQQRKATGRGTSFPADEIPLERMSREGLGRLIRLLISRIEYDGTAQELTVSYRPIRPGDLGGESRSSCSIEPTRHRPEFIARHEARRRWSVQPGSPALWVPRVRELMALAQQAQSMLAAGTAGCRADLAKQVHLSRARVTQILNLLRLAPDIQEAILDLPAQTRRRGRITEHELRPIAAEPDWDRQRTLWNALCIRRLPDPAKSRLPAPPSRPV